MLFLAFEQKMFLFNPKKTNTLKWHVKWWIDLNIECTVWYKTNKQKKKSTNNMFQMDFDTNMRNIKLLLSHKILQMIL